MSSRRECAAYSRAMTFCVVDLLCHMTHLKINPTEWTQSHWNGEFR